MKSDSCNVFVVSIERKALMAQSALRNALIYDLDKRV